MRAPESRITSGMRKEPPISTCWPRETTTSRRAPRAVSASRTAAALLFTTSAASAPVRRCSRSSTSAERSPRRPVSRSSSRLLYPAAISAAASAAARESGALPRLVWSTTPVPLITGRRRGGAPPSPRAARRPPRGAPRRRWGRPAVPAPAAPGWPARPAPVESAPAGPGSRLRSEATRQRAGVQAEVSGALAEYGCGGGLVEDPHHGPQDAEVEQVGPEEDHRRAHDPDRLGVGGHREEEARVAVPEQRFDDPPAVEAGHRQQLEGEDRQVQEEDRVGDGADVAQRRL